ncbi:hypothetical protein LCGC14_3054460, partial [marine sediment metagenome]
MLVVLLLEEILVYNLNNILYNKNVLFFYYKLMDDHYFLSRNIHNCIL